MDSTALHEVAYFCVETLVISSTRDGAQHELDIKLGCVQVDVRDNGASWRSNVMLRPQRARLHNPVRAVKETPFLLCSATWTALDRGAGQARADGHATDMLLGPEIPRFFGHLT